MAPPARHRRHVHRAAPPHPLTPAPFARSSRVGASRLYGLFEDDEAELLGCLSIDPPTKVGHVGAEVSWWVVDRQVGSDVERELDDFVPAWPAEQWPLPAPPRLAGWGISWAEWNALPARDAAAEG